MAQYSLEILAISSSSVDTKILSIYFDFSQAAMEYASKGCPAIFFIFFRGTPLLPPLAGMRAAML